MTTNCFFADAQVAWSDGWQDYLRLMLILGGILIVAFLTLRFWIPKLAQVKSNRRGPIEVVTRFQLEPDRTLYVLAIGQSKLLVASSQAGVQLIRELTENELITSPDNKEEHNNENIFERLMQSIKSPRNV